MIVTLARDLPVGPKIIYKAVILPLDSDEANRTGSDRIFWRQSQERVWAKKLNKDGGSQWKAITLAELFFSWDGQVYAVDKAMLFQVPQYDWALELHDALATMTPDVRPTFEFEAKRYSEKLEQEVQRVVIKAGRANICSSFDRTWASITVRSASSGTWAASEERNPHFVFSFADYCRAIYPFTLGLSEEAANNGSTTEPPVSSSAKHGLLVVIGGTGSGKTEIACGLMHQYLADRNVDFKHTVSLEDPMEKPYHSPDKSGPCPGNPPEGEDDRTHHTGRSKHGDFSQLERGLKDALRQKPAVVYAGEIREQEDWRALLDFAGTGHLIVATAHAGSLTEALSQIFRVCEAKSPQERRELARKILALIHLTPAEFCLNGDFERKFTIPSIWRSAYGGAEGIELFNWESSLIPSRSIYRGNVGALPILDRMLRSHNLEKIHGDIERQLHGLKEEVDRYQKIEFRELLQQRIEQNELKIRKLQERKAFVDANINIEQEEKRSIRLRAARQGITGI